jgi:hypothetical protein
MELKPLTLDQATEIAEDFEDLIGTALGDLKNDPDITHVVIGPYNADELPAFIFDLHLRGSSGSYHNSADEYDVWVIVMNEDGTADECIAIREYISTRGIYYNFPD